MNLTASCRSMGFVNKQTTQNFHLWGHPIDDPYNLGDKHHWMNLWYSFSTKKSKYMLGELGHRPWQANAGATFVTVSIASSICFLRQCDNP